VVVSTPPSEIGIDPRRLRQWKTGAVIAALIFFGGFAAFGVFSHGGAGFAALRSVNPAILPVMLALSCVNYFMRGTRWVMFCKALGLDVPVWHNALYYVAGFALTATPGKAGEAVRLWLLNRGHQFKYRDTASLLIADRLSDAQATALGACVSASFVAGYQRAAFIAFGLVLVATILCFFPRLFLSLVGLFYRITGWMPRMLVMARRVIRPLSRFTHPRVLLASLLLGMCGWFAEGVSLWVVLNALGTPVPVMAAVFVFAFGMIVGALSFLPGGLGSTEATMIGLLHLLGVPMPQALAATAVVRVTTLWFAVSLGFLAMPLAVRLQRDMVSA